MYINGLKYIPFLYMIFFYVTTISRHAYEVSEAGFVYDLFLLIILLQEPKSCWRHISRTAWSSTRAVSQEPFAVET